MMVREPPSSMLRAAPKKRLGRSMHEHPHHRLIPYLMMESPCCRHVQDGNESSKITTSFYAQLNVLAFQSPFQQPERGGQVLHQMLMQQLHHEQYVPSL